MSRAGSLAALAACCVACTFLDPLGDLSRGGPSGAPSWTKVIDRKRATDWSPAGILGGLPDASWTQCGGVIAPYSGTADAINTQLSGCGGNQYVALGAGTFTLSTSIVFPQTGHIALRGAGASQTFLAFTGIGGSGGGCKGGDGFVSLCGDDASSLVQPSAVYDWTGGFAQGTTRVTLSDAAGIVPGSTVLVLNQCDTGTAGSPCAGTVADDGGFFVCASRYDGTSGCAAEPAEGTTYDGENRFQEEMFWVTAVDEGGCGATCVTISPGVRAPDFDPARTPQAWFFHPLAQAGLEDLSIDGSAAPKSGPGIAVRDCYECFVSGVRTTNVYGQSIDASGAFHDVFRSDYLYGTAGDLGILPGAIRFRLSADDLVENDVVQQASIPVIFDYSDAGSVVAHNFFVFQQGFADTVWGTELWSGTGDALELSEGNVETGVLLDDDYGTHQMVTMFRNRYAGWTSCGNGQCGSVTSKDVGAYAVRDDAFNRFMNVVGNVLGTEGFHTSYGGQGAGDHSVYGLASGNGGVMPPVPDDPLVVSTLLRWGNYDVATDAVRWCGDASSPGWATTCGGVSEVPAMASPYPNPVPSGSALPASFYLSAKPSWWGSLPWPAIGPDVTGGNLGKCSGSLDTKGAYAGVGCTSDAQCRSAAAPNATCDPSLGGHANANPAMKCYLEVMGGPPDGSGSALTFDARACYGD